MPVPTNVSQHYGVAPEEYWREQYFEPSDEHFQGQIETFSRLWQGRGTPTALDIGAGLGKVLRALSRAGFDAFGLEPSKPFVSRALALGGIEPERLQLSAVEHAEYPRDSFDFVSFGAVLEHLPDPATAISRALDWAAPNGLIYVEVPSARWMTARVVNWAYRLQGLDYAANISPMHRPYHLYEFTLRAFHEHARRAGYRMAGYQWYVGDRTFLPTTVDPIARRLMRATRTGMQLEVWLTKRPSTSN
jgi:SAM-dependent methyltransferase